MHYARNFLFISQYVQIRYPINQRIQRGANNRYRANGPTSMLANRFVNTKPKKVKAKKEKKISKSEDTEEKETDEKKKIKEEEEQEVVVKSENG